MADLIPEPDLQGVRPSLVQLTHIIYALHAAAVVIGVTSSATVAGGFVFGLLIITIIGIPLAWILIALLGLWVGYRVVRGWIALSGARAVG